MLCVICCLLSRYVYLVIFLCYLFFVVWFFFCFFFFFFNDTATTEIYTLSLHDALPICRMSCPRTAATGRPALRAARVRSPRSEEHTSELQSHVNLVCRLLLEKKKKKKNKNTHTITQKTTT